MHKHKDAFLLETERFKLVELEKKDASDRYLSWLSSKAGEFLSFKACEKESLENYIRSQRVNENVLLLGIYTLLDDEHIGNIKFEFIDKAKKIVEMGILIGEQSHQGVGVASEVIKAFAEYSLVNYGSELMVLGVSKHNTHAIAVYKKIGFDYEYRPLSAIDSEDGILMSWSFKSEK
ncbi:GNAT family N-acetyltransferase [Pseudoalteromonas ostreae]|uniref:GNAT family N-acetyltransferase n=1 Tax=Pseudoalteromonas ostreae TaxID=2774154 RepID=UPI001B38F563|nr:GNAT family N-acetyltransferase [Pseudoalteromonas ostreae]